MIITLRGALDYLASLDGSLPAGDFLGWLARNFPVDTPDPSEDPDVYEISLRLEYAFGLSPKSTHPRALTQEHSPKSTHPRALTQEPGPGSIST